MYDPVRYFYESVVLVVSGEKSKISIQKVWMWKKIIFQFNNRAELRIIRVRYVPRITWIVSLLVTFRLGKIKQQAIIIPLNMIYVRGKAVIALRKEVPL